MKAKRFTKLVAWLLCVLMIAACLPAAALAEQEWEGDIDRYPVALTVSDNEVTIDSAFAQQGAVASFSAAPGIYAFSIALPEGSDAGMASMKVNGTEILDGDTLNVTVSSPDKAIDITEIYLYDNDGNCIAGKVIINVALVVEGNGTADYPYAIGGMNEDGNLIETATITVPAGQTVYYSSIYGGYKMTISGENGFVVEQGGVQYEDEYGEASLVIPEEAKQGTPALLSVTNNTESEQTYNVTYTQEETDTIERLTLGVEATHSFAENDEFYSYKYIAEKDGELLIHISSTNGWQVDINEGDGTGFSALGDVSPISYNVTEGQEVLINVLTMDANPDVWDTPAGDVTVKVEYKEEVMFPTGDAELKFSNRSMTFQSSLLLSMKVQPEVYEQYENVYVEIQIGDSGEITTMKEPSSIDGIGRRVYAITGIAPYNLDMNMKMTLHGTYQGVENVFVFEMQPLDYCVNRLQNSTDVAFKRLIVDLLNYATASQQYEIANDNTNINETPINSVMTEEQKALASTFVKPDAIADKNYRVIDNPTAEFKQTNVLLRDSINLMFRFECADMNGVTVKVELGDSAWEINEFEYNASTGRYTVYFANLFAYQLSEPVYVTVCRYGVAISNTLRYSVSSYVAGKCTSSDDALANLVKMIQCYGDSALAYFNG